MMRYALERGSYRGSTLAVSVELPKEEMSLSGPIEATLVREAVDSDYASLVTMILQADDELMTPLVKVRR
jgi:hypothetical protein